MVTSLDPELFNSVEMLKFFSEICNHLQYIHTCMYKYIPADYLINEHLQNSD